jgi:hypothetical protein
MREGGRVRDGREGRTEGGREGEGERDYRRHGHTPTGTFPRVRLARASLRSRADLGFRV